MKPGPKIGAGLDPAGLEVLRGLRTLADLRTKLDEKEEETVKRGFELGVPEGAMSVCLGLARNTIGMRRKAGQYR